MTPVPLECPDCRRAGALCPAHAGPDVCLSCGDPIGDEVLLALGSTDCQNCRKSQP